MTDLLLIFPYFNDDLSPFKFPPLGLGYLASYAEEKGYSVKIVDCTFKNWDQAIKDARQADPTVVGVYSMLSMKDAALRFARKMRDHCDLLVAGGPQPTVYPHHFAELFDAVGIGEGEETMLELVEVAEGKRSFESVNGIAYKNGGKRENGNKMSLSLPQIPRDVKFTSPRKRLDFNEIPFPNRELYEHEAYKAYYRLHHGYTETSIMASRGCPFDCDFCSRPIFGRLYKGREPEHVVDEIEMILPYGYDRLWFADDIFPIDRKMVLGMCDEIVTRSFDVEWECLCRVDLMNENLASKMKRAGCFRVFFGLESGSNDVLKLMNKRTTIEQGRRAVESCRKAGIKVGSFFILGYPGESNSTMLATIRFASSLPLDYVSFTIPYPIPGTGLYEKVMHRMITDEWNRPKKSLVDHKLIWASDYSENKLKFGVFKAKTQHEIRKHFGPLYYLAGKPFEHATDYIFEHLR